MAKCELEQQYDQLKNQVNKEISMLAPAKKIAKKTTDTIKKSANEGADTVKKKAQALDGLSFGDKVKTVNRTIEEKADNAIDSFTNFLSDSGVAKVNKDGTMSFFGIKTDKLMDFTNDLGISNVKIMDKIKGIRSKTQALKKKSDETGKAIYKAIEDSGLNDAELSQLVRGNVFTAMSKSPSGAKTFKEYAEHLNKIDIDSVATAIGVPTKDLKKLIDSFGESGKNQIDNTKNIYEIADRLISSRSGMKRLTDKETRLVADLIVKKETPSILLNKLDDTPSNFKSSMRYIEVLEDVVLGTKKQQGYTGYHSDYQYDIKLGSSRRELEALKGDGSWTQVGNSNTFYRKNMDHGYVDGIIPTNNKSYQGKIFNSHEHDLNQVMEQLDRDGIPYTVMKNKGNDISGVRLYPDKGLAAELQYSTNTSKLLVSKFGRLMKERIQREIKQELDDDIKSLFVDKPKDGFVEVPEEVAGAFKKLVGVEEGVLYVKKDVADIVVGSKEFLLYNGDDRLIRAAERTYKDMFKRFKRAVTFKSPSSIVNNYMVIPSMLKMAGVPTKDIPGSMRQAHINYANFVEDMTIYTELITKGKKVDAEKFFNSKKDNPFFEMLDNGVMQSGVDDAILQLGNEADMFNYGVDKMIKTLDPSPSGAPKSKGAETTETIIKNIELDPNSKIGNFFLNKFVMSDIVGRGSMYSYFRKQGMSEAQASKEVNDLFVDYSTPPPKTIQVLEEYGVPFLGWMYKVQKPLFKLMKKNPTEAAAIIASFYAIQHMVAGEDGTKEGYIGDLKMDSWMMHNSLADPTILSSSIFSTGELPNMAPGLEKEVAGVVTGDKHPLEIMGLNIR